MRNLIILFAHLVAGGAYATTNNSTTNSLELLPSIHISKSPLVSNNMTIIKKIDCRIIAISFYKYHSNHFFVGAGTRNLNYIRNFAAKNTSIGFDEPHINGANADGNVIFIDGVRMLPSSFTEFNIIGFK